MHRFVEGDVRASQGRARPHHAWLAGAMRRTGRAVRRGTSLQVVTGRQGTAARSRERTAGSGDARSRPAEHRGQGTRARGAPPAPLPGTGTALPPGLTEEGPRGLCAPRGPSSCPSARRPRDRDPHHTGESGPPEQPFQPFADQTCRIKKRWEGPAFGGGCRSLCAAGVTRPHPTPLRYPVTSSAAPPAPPGTAAAARRTRPPGPPGRRAPPASAARRPLPGPGAGPPRPCWARTTSPAPPAR